MKIKIVNQRLYLDPPETAEGTREYLRVEFSFSEEWKGLTKTAFFRGAKGNICSQLLENDACTVPAEALAAPGRVVLLASIQFLPQYQNPLFQIRVPIHHTLKTDQ